MKKLFPLFSTQLLLHTTTGINLPVLAVIYPDDEIFIGNKDFTRMMLRNDKVIKCYTFQQIFDWLRDTRGIRVKFEPIDDNQVEAFIYWPGTGWKSFASTHASYNEAELTERLVISLIRDIK